jgi:hypothetical protein
MRVNSLAFERRLQRFDENFRAARRGPKKRLAL